MPVPIRTSTTPSNTPISSAWREIGTYRAGSGRSIYDGPFARVSDRWLAIPTFVTARFDKLYKLRPKPVCGGVAASAHASPLADDRKLAAGRGFDANRE